MSIESRVSVLQPKVNRLMSLLVLSIGAVIVMSVLYSGAEQAEAYNSSAPKVIKAHKFIVTNSNGREIAALGTIDGDTGLVIKHKDAQIVLGAAADGTGLFVFDSSGNVRIGSVYMPERDKAMMAVGGSRGNMEWIAPN